MYLSRLNLLCNFEVFMSGNNSKPSNKFRPKFTCHFETDVFAPLSPVKAFYWRYCPLKLIVSNLRQMPDS